MLIDSRRHVLEVDGGHGGKADALPGVMHILWEVWMWAAEKISDDNQNVNSGDLNTKLVGYLGHGHVPESQVVHYSNCNLIGEQKVHSLDHRMVQ